MEGKTLYLVDGTAQLYRAYFAIRGLTNSEGLPTSAVFGFTNMLRKLIQDEQPEYLAVTFDLPGPVFRHESYGEYKANRPPTPEDLKLQAPYARRICEALGVRVLEEAGYEADDLIATYTGRARAEGLEVVVVAADKDLLQLVGDGVTVLNPSKELRLDAEGVAASFGVAPDRVRDVLGLMGDSVDNIPGVPGVGEKTAISAVGTYGDVEAVIARAGRFVALFDARDALLAILLEVEKAAVLDRETARQTRQIAERLLEVAGEFVRLEGETEFRDRVAALATVVTEADLASLETAAGEPGKNRAKALRPVKKELKALDRGSARRIWYSIHEYADQARLSLELATLCRDAPLRRQPAELVLGEPDPEQVTSLFRTLGFHSLIDGWLSTGSAGSVTERATRPSHEVILDRSRLREIAADCRASGRFALGTVADGADPMRAGLIGLALSCQPGAGFYIPLAHAYLGAPEQLSVEDVRHELGGVLAEVELAKLGAGFKRDLHLLRRHGLGSSGWKLDVSVAAFLLQPGRSNYSVAVLAREFLSTEIARGEDAGKPAPAETEVERIAERAAEEAEAVLRLADVLVARLTEAGLVDVYEQIDGPLLPLLVEMEAAGIRVETALLEGMSAEMELSLDRLRGEIHERAGTEFNVDSPKQLREILFERLGLKPRRKTAKSGVASTDAQTLEELAEDHEIARALLEYRELAKLKGTYVDSLPRLVNPQTGRVHTSYHPTGAATGRLSSSDPNLQNIPARTEAGRQIRSAFVPDPGKVFLASDYSQIELRVLAHMAEDPALIAAFQAGDDIHRYSASKVFGVLPELVTDAMRTRAKAVNFGILYGMSETRLAREQGMKRAEARKFIQAYFDRFAGVRTYIDVIREQAARDGAVRTLFGRIRLFPQLHQRLNRAAREQALRAAVNTTLQGTAADLMKLAMLRVDRELKQAGLDARILLQVHDELLLEVPAPILDDVQKRVRRAMEGVHELRVPLVVDQKSGNSWLEVT